MNIRNNKGITLMAEVLTIILLILIISIISYSSMSSLQIRNLNNMYSDIVNIQEKAANYYLKYGTAPVNNTDEGKVPEELLEIESVYNQLNPNDVMNAQYGYYKVDLSLLKDITLNNEQTDDGYYFMNTKTLTVYYSKGVEIDNLNGASKVETYYTLPSNHEKIKRLDVGFYQN